jgi:hypothetical protein
MSTRLARSSRTLEAWGHEYREVNRPLESGQGPRTQDTGWNPGPATAHLCASVCGGLFLSCVYTLSDDYKTTHFLIAGAILYVVAMASVVAETYLTDLTDGKWVTAVVGALAFVSGSEHAVWNKSADCGNGFEAELHHRVPLAGWTSLFFSCTASVYPFLNLRVDRHWLAGYAAGLLFYVGKEIADDDIINQCSARSFDWGGLYGPVLYLPILACVSEILSRLFGVGVRLKV